MDPFDDYVQADELEYDSCGDPFEDYEAEDTEYEIDNQADDVVMPFIF